MPETVEQLQAIPLMTAPNYAKFGTALLEISQKFAFQKLGMVKIKLVLPISFYEFQKVIN